MVLRVILFNYLARTGKESGLTAAMAISVAWNCFVSAQSLEQPINAFIFNKMLAEELKQSVIRFDATDCLSLITVDLPPFLCVCLVTSPVYACLHCSLTEV